MSNILKENESSFIKAGEAIKNGEIIVVPTDTVYAVLCDANNPQAVRKLRKIRQSPNDKPLTLIIDKEAIKKYCLFKNSEYPKMLDALLPGKVSFLLNKKGKIFEDAVPNTDALCVFWQNNATSNVYKHSECVLAISSANTKSLPEATTISEAIKYFGDSISVYIEGDENKGDQGTTQLDIRGDSINVMRESEFLPIKSIKDQLYKKSINVSFQD